jgi:imidazolonepropionase-like amidohydrolase
MSPTLSRVRIASAGLLLVIAALAGAQPTSSSPLAPPANGPRRADPNWVALSDVTVHAKSGDVAHRAVVVYKDGLIQAILPGSLGADGKENTDDDTIARAPMGPAIIKAKGLHVYPAFIDAYVEVDAPAPAPRGDGRGAIESHWNDAVTPQRRALDGPGIDDATAKGLRELGFAAAAISPKGGNFRGRSAVVSLARAAGLASADKPPVYRDDAFQTFSFETGNRGYPDSQMGAIALVRQAFSDALWLSKNNLPNLEVPHCLVHLAPSHLNPQWLVFDSADELEALRADKVYEEFIEAGGEARGMLILGCGTEYARLDAIKQDEHKYILPLNFPKAPDVSSPGKAEAIDLREMMAWEQAPTNPRRLASAGVTFALTTSKLKSRADFAAHLRKAIAFGLTHDQALASLTTTPAELLGVADQLGTVEPGKRANLILATGPIFDKKTKIRATIVDGLLHEADQPKVDLAGTWRTDMITPDGAVRTLVIAKDGSVEVIKVTPAPPPPADQPAEAGKEPPKPVTVKAKARKVSQQDGFLTFVFDHDDFGDDGIASVALTFDVEESEGAAAPTAKTGQGRVVLPGGRVVQYSITRDPPSLAGDWPMLFDGDDKGEHVGGLLRITSADDLSKDRTPKVEIVNVDPATNAESKAAARDVTWDGVTLTYKLTSEDMGGKYPGVSVTITPDFAATPAQLKGVVKNEAGEWRFAARKLDDAEKWWKGTWIVVRMDGTSESNGQDDDKVRLEFTEKKLTVIFSEPGKKDVRIEADDLKIEGNTITFTHDLKPLGFEGKSSDVITRVGAELRGVGTLPDGSKHEYAARLEVKDDKDEAAEFEQLLAGLPDKLPVPFGPYGFFEQPRRGRVLITNATIWTNDDDASPPDANGNLGVLPERSILIEDGIIKAIVPMTQGIEVSPTDTIINATGMHLTAGIIDAHSHTGISRGVNEGGQAVTAEVRIQDVTNPDDVNWYRQLAGGVTSVLQLHGSANSIGGQSQTTKLRWGAARPEDMHFEGAIPGIKFALGENPKQVNWDAQTTRYPRSRMGVEMLIRDRFTAAKEYGSGASQPPRKDLELEPLAEILAGTRLIHCHSYRQDEIVMLTQVARDFGFKIGTYQHILEGYKVADFVRDYSGGGSGFADWWAFKVEVQDAIPAGLPLMQKVGATTSFNSDSNNLARFLNVEAAKAVKYGREVGGFSESEAWKFVTLNPAKQLRVHDKVGKVKVGMHADLVLWTANPMSTYALVDRTFVDGRELYSRQQDAQHREWIAKERDRLLTKILVEKKKDDAKDDKADAGEASPGRRGRRPGDDTGASNTSAEEREHLRLLHLEMLRSGRDPRYMPGVCGCGWHAW